MHNETTLRVRYAETDQMGVVYYANYFVWMELGRVEYCRGIGFRCRDMEEQDGILLAVIDAQCRYRRPARYDDEVTVRTHVSTASRRGVEFSYEMFVREELIASGSTRHVGDACSNTSGCSSIDTFITFRSSRCTSPGP